MRRFTLLTRLVPLAALGVLALGGCSEQFTNEEMQLGIAAKPRPLAILCEPPEAAPGEAVTVTLIFHELDNPETDVSWRAALDYDPGNYGADIVERRLVDLDTMSVIPGWSDDGRGFRTLSFTWTVPDSTLLWASCLPEQLDDPALIGLAALLLPGLPEGGATRTAVDAYLRSLTNADMDALPPETRELLWDLADLFACQVRLRATVHGGVRVDVTRSLTIRHSRRLRSPNANDNPRLTTFEVVGIPQADFDWSDIGNFTGGATHYPFTVGDDVPELRIPRRDGWTYYLTESTTTQSYTSPFSGDRLFEEKMTQRWYFFRLDDPASGSDFFVTDEGDDAEMYAMDEAVRLKPPAGAAPRFRVALCVRDHRAEWEQYHATPGATLAFGDIVFE